MLIWEVRIPFLANVVLELEVGEMVAIIGAGVFGLISKGNAMDSDTNPWTCLYTQAIYENPWIRVCEDKVLNPGGGHGIYGRVLFKNRAIGIIPVDDDGNTWLVGQYRYVLEAYSWEIPMGGAPLEEDILIAAKRELAEETGLRAERWTEVIKIHLSNSVTNEVGFAYLAEGLSLGDQNPEESEALKVWKLPLQEAVEMASDGKITDSLSVAGLLKLGRIKKI